MKAASFAYERPPDFKAALALMTKVEGSSKIIAGGQVLGPTLNLRLGEPNLIIDIAGLSQLKQAERSGDEPLSRAGTPHGASEDGRIPDVTRRARPTGAGRVRY